MPDAVAVALLRDDSRVRLENAGIYIAPQFCRDDPLPPQEYAVCRRDGSVLTRGGRWNAVSAAQFATYDAALIAGRMAMLVEEKRA